MSLIKTLLRLGGVVYSSSGSTGEARDIIYTDYVINGAARRTTELLSLVPHRLKSMKAVVLWGVWSISTRALLLVIYERVGLSSVPFWVG